MYRFLATRRWLGYAALTVLAAVAMVALGFWQLDRYHQRAAINARISAGESGAATSLAEVLAHPAGGPGTVGAPPPAAVTWRRVTVTGRYDAAHEILVRGRTVAGRVGFEVLTPLVLGDGTAVLVDRGWVAPAESGAQALPSVPPAPTGTVTVVGQVRPPESHADRPRSVGGRPEVRRIAPAVIAPTMPFPVYGAHVAVAQPLAAGMVAVPAEKENALQNAGYVLQWWLFALLTVFGFGYLARREAHEADAPIGEDMLDATPVA